jgi:hypothetical protein
MVLFCGSTENVRPHDFSQLKSSLSPYLRSGLGEEHLLVRYFLAIVAGYRIHCDHKFCDHTTHYEITRRRKRYPSVFLLRFSR